MKKVFILAALTLLLFTHASAEAATIRLTLQWDANTEADLAGYRLYKSTTSGSYTFGAANAVASYGKVTTGAADVTGAEGQRVYFVLTAFDLTGNESGPSNEVSYVIPDTTPPAAPKNFIVKLFQVLLAWFRGLHIAG